MNSLPVHTKRDLLIVACNTNGLAARYEELVEFAARHKADMLLVGETHLNPNRRFLLLPTMCFTGTIGSGV